MRRPSIILTKPRSSRKFPTEVRSGGMAFGITGWAIGLGAGTLYNPVMFASIGCYGFFVYAGLNLVWFVLIYLFLPATSRRSLEAIERLFETRSPFVKDMERHFKATEAPWLGGFGRAY
ncbi:unnamed protein product [Zymoseptoria tritici ST99CH_3D1]|uniref:Major facilitator superfamily (MFS) profile domain-containing protein n=1 Tax=Zymoseptoria tritici ST99CH_1E4 TaxID=1276532 RepID=A0A2H1FP71_ZYMTR|nr:unnamed protein product [Zymoseptoria tritici ST99CH_1E4]SMR45273.1 unnamed protein product [Zymoseptoria tritici ST99CH_3D1]